MLNFLDFVLLIILVLVIMIVLFFATGVIYNQEGYVSIIKKGNKFYRIEDKRFSYYLPILFRKAGYYPIKPKEYKVNDQKVLIYVKDPMLLYKHKVNLKKLLKQNKNLEDNLKKYKIVMKKK